MRRDTCRSCKAAVIWAANDKSRQSAPIDAEPAADGNVVFEGECYRVLTKAERALPATAPRHKNHFSTCPQNQQWRKKS